MKKEKNKIKKGESDIKKDNRNFLIISLLIVVCAMAILIALMFNKLLSMDSVMSDNNQSGNSGGMVMSNSDAKYLVSKYMQDINYYWYQPLDVTNLLHDGLSDKFKVLITINNASNLFVSNEDHKIDLDCLKAFPNIKHVKLDYTDNAYNYIFDSTDFGSTLCGIKDQNNYGGKYNYDDLNKVYKYLFGNDTNLPKTYISKALSFYAYSDYYKSYLYLQRWGGGPTYIYQYYDVSSVNEKDGDLEVNIKFLEFDYKSIPERVIYNSKSGMKYEYTQNQLYGVEVYYDYAKEVLNEIYNKENKYLDEYKFTFGKVDNHYYLKSITKV